MSNEKKYPIKFMEQRRSKNKGKNGEYSIYLVTTQDLIIPGYKKKDGTKVEDQFVPRFSFVDLIGEPSDEEIIAAENEVSEGYAKLLQNRKDNWGVKFVKGQKVQEKELLRKEYHVRLDGKSEE